MNLAKNMEAIFVAALALSCVTAFASSSPAPRVEAPVLDMNTENMVTIVITGKRMTDAQKALLDS